jgi:thiamine biosynthesis lipoprotein
MKKPIACFLLISSVALFVFVVFRRPKIEPIEKTYLFFDTFVRISLYPAPAAEAENLFPLIEEELERIQHRFGYGDTSLSSLLATRKGPVVLTDEDLHLLKRAIQFSEQTDGAFDITVGVLEQLWGFKDETPHLPQENEIAHALHSVGYQYITVLDSSLSLKEGLIIDLGGISKGYAVDRIVRLLEQKGIPAGLVDAGGDLRVFGSKPDGSKWTIGIKHPQERGGVVGTFEIESGAVATSGNYERSFFENGIRYHHIIDLRTGYPATGCISVTILAADAVTADALATAVFVLGPDRGMALVENLPHIEAVIVFEKKGKMEVTTSTGVCLK